MSIIYVNFNAVGDNNGSSWANAYTDLQYALDTAAEGDEIWVAKGTYYPTDNNDRTVSFVIPNQVQVYGGFAGNETTREQRNVEQNITILSGNIGNLEDKVDNSTTVVRIENAEENTLLDGFSVTEGFAENKAGAGIDLLDSNATLNNLKIYNNETESYGGGIYINNNNLSQSNSSQLKNIFIYNNYAQYGGGIYITNDDLYYYSNDKTNLDNVTIQGNFANNGGGIYHDDEGNLNINNSQFINNVSATTGGAITNHSYNSIPNLNISNSIFKCNIAKNNGGGIYNYEGTFGENHNITINNNLFESNLSVSGGGVYNATDNANFEIVNSTFVKNKSSYGSAVSNDESNNGEDNLKLINSIVYNNKSFLSKEFITNIEADTFVNNSLIEGGYEGEGNINNNPLFINHNNSDYRLGENSPAIDRGNNDEIPEGINSDLAGNSRVFGDQVDLGAYEYSPQSNSTQFNNNSTIIYVNINASGANNGISWNNAYTDLQTALANAPFNSQIWVADGTYKPSNDDREKSFVIPNGVSLYGGFAGNETSLNERNWQSNETILSGNIGAESDNTDNSYHVINISNTTSATVLDGFFVRDGYADASSNTSLSNGAGIYGKNSYAILNNLEISNNNANEDGGGFYTENSFPQLSNIIFSQNIAGRGGAFYGTNSNSIFQKVSFEENEAKVGGAIYASNEIIILDSNFRNNKAQNSTSSSSNVGGAIYLYSGKGLIEKTSFIANEAEKSGGAIYNTSKLRIVNSIFNSNRSNQSGGAIFNYDGYGNSGSLKGINLTFANNQSIEGTAIYNDSNSNTASLSLYNSILWHNQGVEDEEGNTNNAPIVNSRSMSSTSVNASIVEGGYEGGREIITSNPQFVDVENGNLRLKANSPAINQGNNEITDVFEFDATDTDISNSPRLVENTVDLGAYEYRPYLSINDVTVTEGDENSQSLIFTVSLNEAVQEIITVNYRINDNSAKAEEDYTDTSGTLTFAAGEIEKTITVNISGDTTVEENERFFVELSGLTGNVALGDSRGIGTIENDDNNSDPSPNPETDPEIDLNQNTIDLFRFRNTTFSSGTYVFVAAPEKDGIENNSEYNRTFSLDGRQEDGSVNVAFKASETYGDELIPFYRLASLDVLGTYLFVSTEEYNDIFAEDSVQRDKWQKEGLNEENGEDVPEFYLYDNSANMGVEFNRFQNRENGTFLYAGPNETQDIENDPNLSSLFVNQGVAFESLI